MLVFVGKKGKKHSKYCLVCMKKQLLINDHNYREEGTQEEVQVGKTL